MILYQLNLVQLLSRVQLFATHWTVPCQASLSITNSRSLLKLMSIDLVMSSNHLISVVPFSSCLQSFAASGSFQMSQFFASGGQSIGVSTSTSVLPMNIQDWFPLRWTGWISLLSKGLSRVFSNTTVQKHQIVGAQPSWSDFHVHMHTWPLEKPQLRLYDLRWQSDTPAFQYAVLPRSRCLSSVAAATVCNNSEAQENKVCHCFPFCPPSICQEVMGPEAMIFAFWMLSFMPAFLLFSFTFINSLFSSSSFSFIRMIRILLNFKMLRQETFLCPTPHNGSLPLWANAGVLPGPQPAPCLRDPLPPAPH